VPVDYYEEHYALYAAYQRSRHHDQTKTETSEADEIEQYKNFLCQSNVESVLVEFRDQDELKMVSVIDIVRDGISAVYTFYNTSDIGTSYGTYNVMWQAEWTKNLGLAYLYLGYWIKDSQKMAYKQNYKPLQKLINGEWD
jgi:arginine-tRNA-protein transferase